MLEGYQTPDSGRVRVLGQAPRQGGRAWRARIGVMLLDGGLYPALRPPEVLHLFARYYERPLDPDELLRMVGLDGSRRTSLRRLSGGEKQRLSLAAALIGRPEVLFLDEPSAGMDPRARRLTWEIIREQQARGVTVLLTTHYLEEAEQLAGRVAIIHHGRLLALDTPLALRQVGRTGMRTVRLRAATPLDPAMFTGVPSVRGLRTDEDGALVAETERPADALADLAARARDAGIELSGLVVGDASLEDAFLRLTGTPLAAEEALT
jgi:ABC-2 type transport system ATP-binding protein